MPNITKNTGYTPGQQTVVKAIESSNAKPKSTVGQFALGVLKNGLAETIVSNSEFYQNKTPEEQRKIDLWCSVADTALSMAIPASRIPLYAGPIAKGLLGFLKVYGTSSNFGEVGKYIDQEIATAQKNKKLEKSGELSPEEKKKIVDAKNPIFEDFFSLAGGLVGGGMLGNAKFIRPSEATTAAGAGIKKVTQKFLTNEAMSDFAGSNIGKKIFTGIGVGHLGSTVKDITDTARGKKEMTPYEMIREGAFGIFDVLGIVGSYTKTGDRHTKAVVDDLIKKYSNLKQKGIITTDRQTKDYKKLLDAAIDDALALDENTSALKRNSIKENIIEQILGKSHTDENLNTAGNEERYIKTIADLNYYLESKGYNAKLKGGENSILARLIKFKERIMLPDEGLGSGSNKYSGLLQIQKQAADKFTGFRITRGALHGAQKQLSTRNPAKIAKGFVSGGIGGAKQALMFDAISDFAPVVVHGASKVSPKVNKAVQMLMSENKDPNTVQADLAPLGFNSLEGLSVALSNIQQYLNARTGVLAEKNIYLNTEEGIGLKRFAHQLSDVAKWFKSNSRIAKTELSDNAVMMVPNINRNSIAEAYDFKPVKLIESQVSLPEGYETINGTQYLRNGLLRGNYTGRFLMDPSDIMKGVDNSTIRNTLYEKLKKNRTVQRVISDWKTQYMANNNIDGFEWNAKGFNEYISKNKGLDLGNGTKIGKEKVNEYILKSLVSDNLVPDVKSRITNDLGFLAPWGDENVFILPNIKNQTIKIKSPYNTSKTHEINLYNNAEEALGLFQKFTGDKAPSIQTLRERYNNSRDFNMIGSVFGGYHPSKLKLTVAPSENIAGPLTRSLRKLDSRRGRQTVQRLTSKETLDSKLVSSLNKEAAKSIDNTIGNNGRFIYDDGSYADITGHSTTFVANGDNVYFSAYDVFELNLNGTWNAGSLISNLGNALQRNRILQKTPWKKVDVILNEKQINSIKSLWDLPIEHITKKNLGKETANIIKRLASELKQHKKLSEGAKEALRTINKEVAAQKGSGEQASNFGQIKRNQDEFNAVGAVYKSLAERNRSTSNTKERMNITETKDPIEAATNYGNSKLKNIGAMYRNFIKGASPETRYDSIRNKALRFLSDTKELDFKNLKLDRLRKARKYINDYLGTNHLVTKTGQIYNASSSNNN